MLIVTACLVTAAAAAWISIMPWLKEHDAAVHLTDSSNLKSSLEQIKTVEKVADLIRQSNAQWQGVQEASARTVTSAREITERMKMEADEFMKFISNAHDQERAGLRLEVEKLRRMEGDWIKVAVQMLDHVFALTRAAERSGQPQLIKQLNQFQGACRDVARRMGLSTFVPSSGEPFDARGHQLPNPQMVAKEGDRVQDVLACGFTYQGQLLRRALVMLEGEQSAGEVTAPSEEETRPESALPEAPASTAPIAVQEEHSEPPAIIDSTSDVVEEEQTFEADQRAAADQRESEQFEEPPAIVDTYREPQAEQEVTEQRAAAETFADETSDRPEQVPAPRAQRQKKRAGQEELPF